MLIDDKNAKLARRRFIRRSATLGAAIALNSALPAWARSGPATSLVGLKPLAGTDFDLTVDSARTAIDGRVGESVLVNGQLPAPLLRWREGDDLTLRVTNRLSVDTSIHWHGILLPFQMDGVPGVTFPGIKPGQTFTYRFPLKQAGTYWYHSHSGLQEQSGHYGPIVVDPSEPDPFGYEREYVIVLSDWTFENPHRVFAKLKKMSDYYNFQQRTLGELVSDTQRDGLRPTLQERRMWGAMRMNPTDIADVTGATYTYLINGHGPADNWTGLFKPGERIRLRFINASAMSIFDVRIPGLPMTVVQADGLNVQPVATDEFQIGTAETFDVVIHPTENEAYSLVAESNDRSGFARATLTPELGRVARVPERRPRPTLTMKDMAMNHSSHAMPESEIADVDVDRGDHSRMRHRQTDHADSHPAGNDHEAPGSAKTSHSISDGSSNPQDFDHASMDHGNKRPSDRRHSVMSHAEMDHAATDRDSMQHVSQDHSSMGHSEMSHAEMDHVAMGHGAEDHSMNHAEMSHSEMNDAAMGHEGHGASSGGSQSHDHPRGAGVVGLADNPVNRLGERPLGLMNEPHRVLVYTDLKARQRNPDTRPPEREMELHLTSNMERYMWSFDGQKFSEVDGPIVFYKNERVRMTLVNDTMMPHPIHLHGMFFDVVTDDHAYKPRKHTIVVKPGEKLSVDVTADADGDWAFHCHLLYHMHAGMMRVVSVIDKDRDV